MRANLPSGGRQPGAAKNEALERARFAIQMNRPDQAQQIATEILRTNSADRDAIKTLGYALIMLKRPGEAMEILESAARRSHDPELDTQLAIAFQQCGRTEDAILWLKRAIKRKSPQASAFFELGFILNSLYRHSEAADVLRKGVETAPMMVDMTVQLGIAYSGMNDRPNAIACFRRALANNPVHLGAMFGLGDVLMNDRDFTQAADVFGRLVAADPANADARIRFGNCLLILGQTDVGFACMRAAAARGPKFYGKALRALTSSSHGRCWLRPSDAAKFLRRDTRGR